LDINLPIEVRFLRRLFIFAFVNREELLDYIMSVLELGVILFKSQFDAHIVVLVLRKTETISFQSITVRHPSVAEEHLGTFRVFLSTGSNDEIVVGRNILQECIPHSEALLFVQIDLLLFLLFFLFRGFGTFQIAAFI